MEADCARVVDLLFSTDLAQQERGCRVIQSTMFQHPDLPDQLGFGYRRVVECMDRLAAPRGGLYARLVALALCHPDPGARDLSLQAVSALCSPDFPDLTALLATRGLQRLLEGRVLSLTAQGAAQADWVGALIGLELARNLCVLPLQAQERAWLLQQGFADAALFMLRLSLAPSIPPDWAARLSAVGMGYLGSWLQLLRGLDVPGVRATATAATKLLLQHQLYLGEPSVRAAATGLLDAVSGTVPHLRQLMLQHDLSPLLEALRDCDSMPATCGARLAFHPSLLPFTTGTLAPELAASLGAATDDAYDVFSTLTIVTYSIAGSQVAQAFAKALVSARIFAAMARHWQPGVLYVRSTLQCLCYLFTLGPWMAQAAADDACVRRLLRGVVGGGASGHASWGSADIALTQELLDTARSGGLRPDDARQAWAALDVRRILSEPGAADGAGGAGASASQGLPAAAAAAQVTPAAAQAQAAPHSSSAAVVLPMSPGSAATGAAAGPASGHGSSSAAVAGAPGAAAAGEAAAAAAGSMAGTSAAPAVAAAHAASTTDTRQRRCAACGALAAAGVKLRLCSLCKSVRYCSKDCQVQHWEAGHRGECRAAPQG